MNVSNPRHARRGLLGRLAFLGLLLTSLAASAQTRYVSDSIPVTLRSGPSLENRILKNLPAGVRVEVLGAEDESGYSHVRVASDGTEGWILTRYLTDQPIARDRLEAVERELGDARSRVNELEAQVASLMEQLAAARGHLEQATSANKDVTSELEQIRSASANAVQLRDQNESLKQRVADAEERLNRLTMQNTELASQSRQQWFMVGAAVLFGGILIGLVAPHLKRKRRSSW